MKTINENIVRTTCRLTRTLSLGLCILLMTTPVSADEENNGLDITFTQNAIIEISFIRTTDLREKEYKFEYLPATLSIFEQYGGVLKILFDVSAYDLKGFFSARNERIPLQYAVYEWPNIEARRAAYDDPEFLDLRNWQDSLITNVTTGIFLSPGNITHRFVEGKIYEIFGGSFSPLAAQLGPQFFDAVVPKSPHFGRVVFLSPLQVLDVVENHVSLLPGFFGMAEFTSPESFYGFVHSDFFSDSVHLRDSAFLQDTSYIVNGRFRYEDLEKIFDYGD